jgi:outer membrane protein
MRKIVTTLVLFSATCSLHAQEVWDLRRCVDFAIANNIQVRQNEIQEDIAEVNLKQISASRIPSLNFQTSGGGQFGRSIDPATNLFTTNSITFLNGGLQTNVTLFNWFSLKNQVAANRLTTEATRKQTEVIQNDISLNIAAAYLQALLSYEQMRIAQVQAGQTREQLEITRKRVTAGALPELNAAELGAQLARDSATLIAAQSTFEINQLSIKAILNLDAAAPFRIAIPPASAIPVDNIADLQPNVVFESAVLQQPRQEANNLRLQAAEKNTAAAKGGLYPTIGAFGNFQTAYSSAFENLPKGPNITTIIPTQSFVSVGGTNFFVNTPISRPEGFSKATVWRQFEFNFRQSVGLSLTVPIFNGYQARSVYERSKLNESTLKLQMLADTLQLKQDIYQAYQSAINSLNTFQSRQRAVETAQYSYDLGTKRYEVGLLPVIELVTLQNNLQRAKIDEASSQYEYIFRLKVLEFYKNNSIKL